MAILTRLLRQVKSTKSAVSECDLNGYIDTLYNYVDFIKHNKTTNVDRSKKVAIIGAGAAGMVAAYNLMGVGLVPDIYEAYGEIGGRTASVPFPSNKNAIAELGAMRIPCGEEIFWHYYRDVFKLAPTPDFPNPGIVNTQIYYQNKRFDWKAGAAPPGPFKAINEDWNAFLNPIVEPILDAWKKRDMKTVKAVWQRYIDTWKNVSFFAALNQGIPQWGDEELNMFGALGVGSGGFGPLYQVNFLEILRLILNRLETDLKQIPQGVRHFTEQFAQNGSVKPNFKFKTPVQGITKIAEGPHKGKIVLAFRDASGTEAESMPYDAVIVATQTGPMELMGMTLPQAAVGNPREMVNLLTQPVKNAVRNLHVERSSKLFILTKDKFWKNLPGEWANIQTDELFFGMYTMDYPQIKEGVVLMSYTWSDDSTRLLPLSAKERFEHFKAIAMRVNPDFAKHLIPVTDKDIVMVDWQKVKYQNGAFKLNYPGQEQDCHSAYYQFQEANSPRTDQGIYLANDGVSWSGGWIEGALQSGVNAAAAVMKRFGGKFSMPSPLDQDPKMYQY